MHVLFTMTGGWGTGSGVVVEALTRAMAARGHRVGVLYPDTEGAPDVRGQHAPEAEHFRWRFPVEERGVRLYTFPLMIPDPNPANFDGAWTFRDLTDDQLALYVRSFRARLLEVVEAFRPDVVECQHVWAMPFAAAEAGLPFFVSAHHSDQMGFEQDARMRPLATRAALAARRIFALTEHNKGEVVAQTGASPEQVVVLGNGFDRSTFFPEAVDRAALLARFGLDVPEDVPLVTFAGKLSRTKGVDVLLEANRLLREQWKNPPAFIVFGAGRLDDVLDADRPEAYRLDGVHLLGHQPPAIVRAFHNAARLSVMPSRSEGFGLAALEAMGCGLPVVVTRVGGPETFAVGPVVPPGDAPALADAIRDVLALPEADYAALRQRALDAALGYSWDAIAEARLRLYEAEGRRAKDEGRKGG